MIANTITLCRIFLTFFVIAMFGEHPYLDIACIATIALIFTLDAVDGFVARIRNETSEFGAILDTGADRIIEIVFWVYFTVAGYLPLWIPLVVMTRGILTDNLQHYITPPKSRLAHALMRSRISRAVYGTMKMLTFLYLAWMHLYAPENLTIKQGGLILATATVVACLIRGISLLIEGWKHLKSAAIN